MRCLCRGCSLKAFTRTRCVDVKRADSREADRCCWWVKCENFSKGIYCTWCIYSRVGMHVQGAGQECKQWALRNRHSCCWVGEKCVYSVQPDGGNSVLTSWTFPGVPVWQRLTSHHFKTSSGSELFMGTNVELFHNDSRSFSSICDTR